MNDREPWNPAPIPDDDETGAAMQNVHNMSIWIHIDHVAETGEVRLVACTDYGVVGAAATFLGIAAIKVQDRIRELKKGAALDG